jgi:hypothetical protein
MGVDNPSDYLIYIKASENMAIHPHPSLAKLLHLARNIDKTHTLPFRLGVPSTGSS